MMHLNIAIDGPAGAGKSTAAKGLAARLGIRYLDTGAMYRAMAVACVRAGIDTLDEEEVRKQLERSEITVRFSEEGQRVLLNGEDVTGMLRTPEISMGASNVSRHPAVRDKLVELQRRTAQEYDVVMDGRDITTNVLPDCPNKFFVTASPEERARRRLLELQGKGDTKETFESVLRDIRERDHNDSTRSYMPLRIAEDAVVVDTTGMTPEEVLDFMEARIQR
jgi:cytidylate kinase